MIPNTSLLPSRFKLGVCLLENSFWFSWLRTDTSVFFTFSFEPRLTSYQRISDLNKISHVFALHLRESHDFTFWKLYFNMTRSEGNKGDSGSAPQLSPAYGELATTGLRIWVFYDLSMSGSRDRKREMWFGNSSAVSWAWSGRGLFQMWQNGVGGVGADGGRIGNKRKSDYQTCKSLTDMFL